MDEKRVNELIDKHADKMQKLEIMQHNFKPGDDPRSEGFRWVNDMIGFYQESYKEKILKDKREIRSDEPLVFELFALVTSKAIYMMPGLESMLKSKSQAIGTLRKLRDTFIVDGHKIYQFIQMCEVRTYNIDKNNKIEMDYVNKYNKPFPGTKPTTNFLVSLEEPDRYGMVLYEIDRKTGDMIHVDRGSVTGFSNDVVTDMPIVEKQGIFDLYDNPDNYGGNYTHIVFRPEDADEIDANIGVLKPTPHQIDRLEEMRRKKKGG